MSAPSIQKLADLIDSRSVQELKSSFGTTDSLAELLGANTCTGLDTKNIKIEQRRQEYGANVLPPPTVKKFIDFVWDAFSDKTLIVLSISAAVSLSIGLYKVFRPNNPEPLAWIEGVSIIAAVIIVILVNSVNDFRKQQKFQCLSKANDDLKLVKVFRGSTDRVEVPIEEIVVGDVISIETGDILCADGILLQGFNVKLDESSLTGETRSIKKSLDADIFMISGTQVVDGTGRMLVLAVGAHSVHGQSLERLKIEQADTPLQVKLGQLAETIARYGLLFAVLLVGICSAIIVARNFEDPQPLSHLLEQLLSVFITGVTLVVVSVPEGLPMAVTLALAYGTLKMLQDNNLVRVLSSCETMGGATCIASDKTGTLTQNKMTVVSGTVCGHRFETDHLPELKKALAKCLLQFENSSCRVSDLLGEGISVNSTAYFDKDHHCVGNKTEVALLQWLEHLEIPVKQFRETTKLINQYPFSSERKSMCTVVESSLLPNKTPTIYSKGAAEMIFERCSHYIDENGSILLLDENAKTRVKKQYERLAQRGLRAISFAYSVPTSPLLQDSDELPDKEGMTWLGVVGIEDPVRPEVPAAVAQCQKSGVDVKMVTGDNVTTAKNIAKSCNILKEGGLVMEGAEFRQLSKEQMLKVVPKLQVLARSRPEDKQILVNALQELGEIVAVTGDGTNDAAALKASHVGFAMGIQGTDVAKEASDIILMDDNFASIVKAILWGRSIKECVQKFLQFQLTVNIVAVALTFLSSLYTCWVGGDWESSESILNPVQLLWVNLLMDTFAALALATEPPTNDLLDRPPADPSAPLIDKEMKVMIAGQSLYQCIVFLSLYFYGESLMNIPTGSLELGSFIFNAFVMAQLFNEINCRKLGFSNRNTFSGILRNKVFIVIWVFSFICQYFIVSYGKFAFQTTPLSLYLWIKSLAIGAGSLLVGYIIRLVGPHLLSKEDHDDHRRSHLPKKESVLRMPGVSVYQVTPRGSRESLLDSKSGWTWLKSKHPSQVAQIDENAEFVINLRREFESDETSHLLSNSQGSMSGEAVNSHNRWNHAIRQVRHQVSVVDAFRRVRRVPVPLSNSKNGSLSRR